MIALLVGACAAVAVMVKAMTAAARILLSMRASQFFCLVAQDGSHSIWHNAGPGRKACRALQNGQRPDPLARAPGRPGVIRAAVTREPDVRPLSAARPGRRPIARPEGSCRG